MKRAVPTPRLPIPKTKYESDLNRALRDWFNQATTSWNDRAVGPALASAATISPSHPIHHITGTVAIATINVPSGSTGPIRLIADNGFSLATSGNIARAATLQVGEHIDLEYDPATSKWYTAHAPNTVDEVTNGAVYGRTKNAYLTANGEPYTFQGAWNAATNYFKGDIVTDGGNTWLATADNTNSAPSTSNANWQIFGATGAGTLPPSGTLSDPTSLAFTITNKSDVLLTWAYPTALPSDFAFFEIRKGTSWAAGTFVDTTAAFTYLITDVPPGTTTYWVGIKNLAGTYDATPPSIGVNVSNLPDVTNLTATITNKRDVKLAWTKVTPFKGFEGYEIRVGSSWASGALVDRTKKSSFIIVDPTPGTSTYWVGVRDKAGNYDANPPSVVATVPALPDVSNLTAVITKKVDLDLRWTGVTRFPGFKGYDVYLGGVTISSITEASNVVTVTTSSNHGFGIGDTVYVSGVTPSGYNGAFVITGTTLNTFTYNNSVTGLTAGSGGACIDLAVASLIASTRKNHHLIVDPAPATNLYWVFVTDHAGNLDTLPPFVSGATTANFAPVAQHILSLFPSAVVNASGGYVDVTNGPAGTAPFNAVLTDQNYTGNIKLTATATPPAGDWIAWYFFDASNNGYVIGVGGTGVDGGVWIDKFTSAGAFTRLASTGLSPRYDGVKTSFTIQIHGATGKFIISVRGQRVLTFTDTTYTINGPIGYGRAVGNTGFGSLYKVNIVEHEAVPYTAKTGNGVPNPNHILKLFPGATVDPNDIFVDITNVRTNVAPFGAVMTTEPWSGNIKVTMRLNPPSTGYADWFFFDAANNGYMISLGGQGSAGGIIINKFTNANPAVFTLVATTGINPRYDGITSTFTIQYHSASGKFVIHANGQEVLTATDKTYTINGPIGYSTDNGGTGLLYNIEITGHTAIHPDNQDVNGRALVDHSRPGHISSRSDYRRAILALNPVGYWRFGDDATTLTPVALNQVSGNNGSLVNGTPLLNQPGLISGDEDGSLKFSTAGDTVTINSYAAIEINTISVAFWIKGPVPSFAWSNLMFKSGGGTASPGWQIFQQFTSNQLDFTIDSSGLAGQNFVPPVAIFDNNLHFVVFTYNSSTGAGQVSIDGAPFLTHAYTAGNIANSSVPLKIGYNPGISNSPDGSFLDELAIFNYVLSQDDVSALYDLGITGPHKITSKRIAANAVTNSAEDRETAAVTLTRNTYISVAKVSYTPFADGDHVRFDVTANVQLSNFSISGTAPDQLLGVIQLDDSASVGQPFASGSTIARFNIKIPVNTSTATCNPLVASTVKPMKWIVPTGQSGIAHTFSVLISMGTAGTSLTGNTVAGDSTSPSASIEVHEFKR